MAIENVHPLMLENRGQSFDSQAKYNESIAFIH